MGEYCPQSCVCTIEHLISTRTWWGTNLAKGLQLGRQETHRLPHQSAQKTRRSNLQAFQNSPSLCRTLRLMDWWDLQAWVWFCKSGGHTVLQLFWNCSELCRILGLMDWWDLQARIMFWPSDCWVLKSLNLYSICSTYSLLSRLK